MPGKTGKSAAPVVRCVHKLEKKGMPPGKAIPICQKSTGASYHRSKKAGKTVRPKKAK